MAKYENLEDDPKTLHSESLLSDKGYDDNQSNSDGSTIIARPSWMEHRLHGRGFVSLRTLIALLSGLVITFCIIIFLLSWVVVDLKQAHLSSSNNAGVSDSNVSQDAAPMTGFYTCGSSSLEAINAGCHFDIFSFGWYSPECTDLQLYNDSMQVFRSQIKDAPGFFLRSVSRSSNYDPLALSTLQNYALGKQSPESTMNDDQEVLVTWEHYLVACTYSWQKVQRAAMRNWPLDEWSSSYALASHCGQNLLHREKKDSESIMGHLKPWYPRCGLEAEDLQKEIAAALNR